MRLEELQGVQQCILFYSVYTVRHCSGLSCSTMVEITDMFVRASARWQPQSLEELSLSPTDQHEAPSFTSVKVAFFWGFVCLVFLGLFVWFFFGFFLGG